MSIAIMLLPLSALNNFLQLAMCTRSSTIDIVMSYNTMTRKDCIIRLSTYSDKDESCNYIPIDRIFV